MYKPGLYRKKGHHNKDLHFEVPDNSISIEASKYPDGGNPRRRTNLGANQTGYSMDFKSMLEEKQDEDDHHTINLGSPTRKDERVGVPAAQGLSESGALFNIISREEKKMKNGADIMQKLKLPTIKVDGMRPRLSREVQRSAIDDPKLKNGFALMK